MPSTPLPQMGSLTGFLLGKGHGTSFLASLIGSSVFFPFGAAQQRECLEDIGFAGKVSRRYMDILNGTFPAIFFLAWYQILMQATILQSPHGLCKTSRP